MTSPSNQPPYPAGPATDQMPDFHSYRERAHYERTKAINLAMSMVWCRITGRRSRRNSDAAFWTA